MSVLLGFLLFKQRTITNTVSQNSHLIKQLSKNFLTEILNRINEAAYSLPGTIKIKYINFFKQSI